MHRGELLYTIRDILCNAGFYVSRVHSMRPVGFDLVARRDNTLLIIKVLTNINALSEEVAQELKTLSSLLHGNPLLIGIRSGTGILEDDVVYDRFGIQTVTPDTLQSHLLEGMPLKVYAGPGGFYVNLNNKKLVALRRERQISLGSFARSVHVSRRTVRLYEDGMNARVDVACRIEDLLGEPLIKDIEIIHSKTSSLNREADSTPSSTSIVPPFQKEIFTFLSSLGYEIIPMGRCPFEAVSVEREKILLTCVHRYDKKLQKKAEIVSSISKITEQKAVVFTDKKGTQDHIQGTPLIVREELKKINCPEDIIDLILERIGS